MPTKIDLLLKSIYIKKLSSLYGNHLKKVILYGSYARGDYNSESDIDLMILVDLNQNEIKQKSKNLSDITFDVNYENDILIMPIVQNKVFFDNWINAYPFYNNIKNEGLELYASYE